ncbi:MAG TPA: cytochrome C oxidase subunit II, partial [Paenibacillus sp.]
MKKTIALMATSVLLLVLAACGSGSNTSSEDNNITPEAELTIEATNYQFDQPEYHLKKGVPVKITFKSKEGNHGMLVPGLRLQLSGKNESKTIVPKEAGEYEMS